uniref:Uncharacterized protein n=1 Tax=Fagus sylvatica TaxID=28930 RepID=A0A2N9EFS0_FAGSY
MAPESRGVGAVFARFSGEDSWSKRGMLPANREFHVVAGVVIFPTHPGPHVNLLRVGKTLCAKAAVREKKCVLLPARFFSNLVPVPDLRKSELGLVRYGPANRGHRGVFGPFEGSFPIGIPAGPDKFLAIREFLVVHECVFFPMCPGLADQLVASQEDSVRKRGNVGGKIPELSAKPYFVGLFSRAWPCTEASLGSQDMILRTEAVGVFLMPRGTAKNLPQFACHSLSDALAVNRLTHGSKVKVGFRFLVFSQNSTFPTSAFSFPSSSDLVLRKFVRLSEFNGLAFGSKHNGGCKSGEPTVWNLSPNTLRGDLTWGLPKLQIGWFQRFGISVQTRLRGDLTWGTTQAANRVVSTIWNLLVQTRLRGDLTLGNYPSCKSGGFNGLESQSKHAANRVVSTVWNLSPNRLRGDLTWGTTQAANRVVSTVWNLSPNRLRGDLTWGTTQAANRVVSTVWNLSPNRLRGDLTWGTTQAANRVVSTVWNLSPNRRFTEAVVAEIVAGSHALDSCECMNIEGQILRKT